MLDTTPTSFWRERATASPVSMRPKPMGPSPTPAGRARLSLDVRIEDVPVIDCDHITLRKGLHHHPSLERPFAYLGGITVETLLARVANSDSLEALGSELARDTGDERGRRMVSWLVEQRILVPSE